MNIWIKRILYGFVVAAAQFVLFKYMKFDVWVTFVLCAALAFLMKLLEHKNFAWGLIIGTVIMAAYGYLLFDNWAKN